MPDHPQSTTTLDLSRYTETTRRELYDRLVHIQFASTSPPGPDFTPPLYSPDEAGLVVFYVFGRWFGAWTNLEEPDHLPESRRVELVRIQPAPGSTAGIMLYEV
jgi:hypothetical protein